MMTEFQASIIKETIEKQTAAIEALEQAEHAVHQAYVKTLELPGVFHGSETIKQLREQLQDYRLSLEWSRIHNREALEKKGRTK